jgi:hypothetical protein
MSKGMQMYQRDHFKKKIDRMLDPLIEQEELLLKSTIADLTESAESNLAKKLGADKVINRLAKAEDDMAKARRQARSFFESTAKKNKTYRANKEWYGTDDDDFSKINVEFCLNQIRKWAKALAEQEAETDEQGKKLSYLRSLKMKMEDDVMEANVSDDLKGVLGQSLLNIGLTWNQKIPALKHFKNGK